MHSKKYLPNNLSNHNCTKITEKVSNIRIYFRIPMGLCEGCFSFDRCYIEDLQIQKFNYEIVMVLFTL